VASVVKDRTGRAIGGGAAAAALLGLGYVGLTWARYGKKASRRGRPDPLLDRFMPAYEVRERHESEVGAPAEVTYTAARDLDQRQSGLVWAIFRGRELLMGSKPARRAPRQGFLEEVLALGWRVLAEEPGRELVLGAVTQPWEANVVFRGLAPEDFAAFNDPGYAKIVWTLAVEPGGRDRSTFRTETRVATTDPESRKLFRRYWSLLSPGIRVIRYESLRLIRREAERRGDSFRGRRSRTSSPATYTASR
jgi:hypothetical protein